MREELRDKERLYHILEAIDNIYEFTKDISFEAFSENKMLRFAVIKNLEIVGEAANLFTKELKKQYSEIIWGDITGLRQCWYTVTTK
jgi:uncharacterized protein with HEPN domain